MSEACRVENELRTYLEAEHQLSLFAWDDEESEDVAECEVCGDNVPTTEFMYEGICEHCYEEGTELSDTQWESDEGDLYDI